MQKLVFFILGLVLIAPILSHGLEVGDDIPYIQYMPPQFAINKNPVVCVVQTSDPLINNYYNTTNITIESIDSWVGGLKERTGGNWNAHIITTSSTNTTPIIGFDKCDIRVQFKMYDLKNPKTAGIAHSEFNQFFLKPTVDINVYTYKLTKVNETNWDANQRTAKEVKDIISHELGHAFGLDHYSNVGINGTNVYHMKLAKESIMYPSVPPFDDPYFHVQDNDYDAIIQKYGRDGWAGEINILPKHYILS